MTALDDLVAPPERASTESVSRGRLRDRLPGLALAREASSFLGVGGVAYVVDVAVFNLLLTVPPFSLWHPSVSRCVAVVVAMVITYTGNRFLTWRHSDSGSSSRDVALFVVFNVIGLAMSLVCLVVSHDLLGLTSRLADNISANVVGLAAGTAFRFWSYRRFVFTA